MVGRLQDALRDAPAVLAAAEAGAGATAVAIRRVRTPIRRLPSGTRVA